MLYAMLLNERWHWHTKITIQQAQYHLGVKTLEISLFRAGLSLPRLEAIYIIIV